MSDKIQPWTAQEFRAVCIALYNGAHGWQTALARRLGVNDRTVRRWASGATPIPGRVQREIMSLDGAINPPEIDFRRDEWIIGDGPVLDTGARREYVIHAWPPRFMCRVVLINENNEMPAVDEGDVDTLTGIVYQADRETLLCEFQWIDRPPSGDTLASLMEAASDALAFSEVG